MNLEKQYNNIMSLYFIFLIIADICRFFFRKKANHKMSSSSDITQTSNPQEQKVLSCSSRPSKDWQNLLDIVFGNVMMMVGMDLLENIPKCRQVCQGWNVMVSQMTKLKKDTMRGEAESLAAKIRDKFSYFHQARVSEFRIAASLAHHELLGSVNIMSCHVVDLASVPTEHLASLASCVTKYVDINNVSNCDIISFLNSVKCEELYISRQSLSSEETMELVRAMETYVERVVLGGWREVSLDIRALTQYSGQGKCGQVEWYDETADRYREEVRSWAEKINWKVTLDNDMKIVIERK